MDEMFNIFIQTDILVQINAFVSAGLVVLIWLIQLMHYPSFHFVDDKKWPTFHKHHTTSISYIVMPLMLIELGVSILLFIFQQDVVSSINLAIVLAIWMITFLLAIPLHRKLERAKDTGVINRLIRINWWRTILWTGKMCVVWWMWTTQK